MLKVFLLSIFFVFSEIQDFSTAQEPKVQDCCWDGNKCSLDEHCSESGGICTSSLLWAKENNVNLTSELHG